MGSSEKSDSAKFLWVVVFEIFLYVSLDVISQLLPPHYSSISQAESDLAVGKYGLIMSINFLNRGILSLLFIFAFLRTLDWLGVTRQQFRAGTYLLGAWAVGAILLAIFPTDVPATPVSWHGAIHLAVALVAFIGGAFGALIFAQKLQKVHELRGLSRLAMPLSVLAVILWIIEFLSFIAPHLNASIGGLIERLFLGSVLFWIGTVSAYLAMHSHKVKIQESK